MSSGTRTSTAKPGQPSAPARVTVKDTRESINRDFHEHFTVAWFGRPLANYLTPPIYNAGWSANQVTVIRMLVAGVGLVLLLLPGPLGPMLAAVVFYLCFVLDCVDGNIARLGGSVSYLGKFLDGLADFVFVLGAPLAAGTGAWLHHGDARVMLAGAVICITSLTSQMVRSRLSFMREWMVQQSGPIETGVMQRLEAPRRIQTWAAAIYVNGSFFAPLVLFLPDQSRHWYVIALVPTQLLPELVWLVATLREARIMLQRPRTSIRSIRKAQ